MSKFDKLSKRAEFRLKLLSGNNVVLVEADGYESEIFAPVIVNNRIYFHNIVSNRRFSNPQNSPLSSTNSSFGISASGHSGSKSRRSIRLTNTSHTLGSRKSMSPKYNRASAGQDAKSSTNLSLQCTSFSPPSSRLQRTSPSKGTNNNPYVNLINSPNDNNYVRSPVLHATPEPARRAVPTPYELVKDTLVQIPAGIRVVRLYKNSTDCKTPSPLPNRKHNEKLIYSDVSKQKISSNYCLQSPTSKHRSNLMISPLELPRKTPSPINTQPNWRKCLTPVRTYSRKSIGTVPIRHDISKTKLTPPKSPPKAAPKGASKAGIIIERLKKRKIKIDKKRTMSPQTIRNQIKKAKDMILPTKNTLPRIPKAYERLKKTPFDLLTNSNNASHLSTKLNNQFRKACVNKASSTIPQYKLLCSMPQKNNKDHIIEKRTRQKSSRVIEKPPMKLKPSLGAAMAIVASEISNKLKEN